ncbi:MAG: trypsin-like serine protease [Myxococcales bacterium]|nr:trypsin-like serine protease [Myxococcota bacterium]MDW8280753.1 trypsin-like serine protease [Myxococcales bacterium]
MKILALSLGTATLALTLAACGPLPDPLPERSQRPIIGGRESRPGQFPTVAGLLLEAFTPDLEDISIPLKCVRGTGLCTATLIRQDVLLTAAHCVTNLFKNVPDIDCPGDPSPPKYTFEPNLVAAVRGGRVVPTEKVVIHPMFAPTPCTDPPDVSRWNDIALVFLSRSLQGVPLQRIARPAEARELLREGTRVGLVGYGKSKVDDNMSDGLQRYGTATLQRVGSHELQVSRQGEQQACQGDSGGPVLANPDAPAAEQVQIGVASRLRTLRCPSLLDLFNPPRCENGVFYTRVDAYADWIQATINKERPTPAPPMEEDPDSEEPDDPTFPDDTEDPTDSASDRQRPNTTGQGGCQSCNASHSPSPSPVALSLLLLGLVSLRRLSARRRPDQG